MGAIRIVPLPSLPPLPPHLTYSECVMIAVVGGLKLEQHEIDGAEGGGKEEDLHDGVVNRDEVGQQIQVPRRKNQREQNLRLAGNSCRNEADAMRLPFHNFVLSTITTTMTTTISTMTTMTTTISIMITTTTTKATHVNVTGT